MIYGRIKSFESKLNSYVGGKDKTPYQLLTLKKEAASLCLAIKNGELSTDEQIIERLKQLVELRNQTISSFDSIASEYYSILENLLKYGTGYRTKTITELSGKIQLGYKKYDEYLSLSERELTKPLVAFKKTYDRPLKHGIKLSSYYTRNKGKTDLIPPHIQEKIKPAGGMDTQ